ncbi:serine-rich adhesin for platelets-like [Ylistrum balloti]|uniref:serine-rich adhesin for platelets-like n=1 Tax=Ylistrum balloti TaxID=509963 RepID=UPI002905B9C5|nr:serine-rich adhesin for platelets-like [Ylistrum balloti]
MVSEALKVSGQEINYVRPALTSAVSPLRFPGFTTIDSPSFSLVPRRGQSFATQFQAYQNGNMQLQHSPISQRMSVFSTNPTIFPYLARPRVHGFMAQNVPGLQSSTNVQFPAVNARAIPPTQNGGMWRVAIPTNLRNAIQGTSLTGEASQSQSVSTLQGLASGSEISGQIAEQSRIDSDNDLTQGKEIKSLDKEANAHVASRSSTAMKIVKPQASESSRRKIKKRQELKLKLEKLRAQRAAEKAKKAAAKKAAAMEAAAREAAAQKAALTAANKAAKMAANIKSTEQTTNKASYTSVLSAKAPKATTSTIPRSQTSTSHSSSTTVSNTMNSLKNSLKDGGLNISPQYLTELMSLGDKHGLDEKTTRNVINHLLNSIRVGNFDFRNRLFSAKQEASFKQLQEKSIRLLAALAAGSSSSSLPARTGVDRSHQSKTEGGSDAGNTDISEYFKQLKSSHSTSDIGSGQTFSSAEVGSNSNDLAVLLKHLQSSQTGTSGGTGSGALDLQTLLTHMNSHAQGASGHQLPSSLSTQQSRSGMNEQQKYTNDIHTNLPQGVNNIPEISRQRGQSKSKSGTRAGSSQGSSWSSSSTSSSHNVKRGNSVAGANQDAELAKMLTLISALQRSQSTKTHGTHGTSSLSSEAEIKKVMTELAKSADGATDAELAYLIKRLSELQSGSEGSGEMQTASSKPRGISSSFSGQHSKGGSQNGGKGGFGHTSSSSSSSSKSFAQTSKSNSLRSTSSKSSRSKSSRSRNSSSERKSSASKSSRSGKTEYIMLYNKGEQKRVRLSDLRRKLLPLVQQKSGHQSEAEIESVVYDIIKKLRLESAKRMRSKDSDSFLLGGRLIEFDNPVGTRAGVSGDLANQASSAGAVDQSAISNFTPSDVLMNTITELVNHRDVPNTASGSATAPASPTPNTDLTRAANSVSEAAPSGFLDSFFTIQQGQIGVPADSRMKGEMSAADAFRFAAMTSLMGENPPLKEVTGEAATNTNSGSATVTLNSNTGTQASTASGSSTSTNSGSMAVHASSGPVTSSNHANTIATQTSNVHTNQPTLSSSGIETTHLAHGTLGIGNTMESPSQHQQGDAGSINSQEQMTSTNINAISDITSHQTPDNMQWIPQGTADATTSGTDPATVQQASKLIDLIIANEMTHQNALGGAHQASGGNIDSTSADMMASLLADQVMAKSGQSPNAALTDALSNVNSQTGQDSINKVASVLADLIAISPQNMQGTGSAVNTMSHGDSGASMFENTHNAGHVQHMSGAGISHDIAGEGQNQNMAGFTNNQDFNMAVSSAHGQASSQGSPTPVV